MLGDVDMTCSAALIRGFLAGDPAATGLLVERAATSAEPAVLVAAALAVPDGEQLLTRAAVAAESAGDRQVVAVAAAHLCGDADRALLLARDHLSDHPDSPLVAYIAAACASVPERNHS